ncbi:Uncharacterised protein [Burkholderia pseudomallei]|nr:Uncharacterised protein [Burkholderia pseudomallei]
MQNMAESGGRMRRKSRRSSVGASDERSQLKLAVAAAAVDLSAAHHLPVVLRRALDVLQRLADGEHPLAMGGQILARRKGDFSVPIGANYRLIVDAMTLRPKLFISHEKYNGLV